GSTRGHRSRYGLGVPPCAHDGTERRIVRPQDSPAQTACYSGKKKDHTVKNVLLVNALLMILFLSDTYGGRTHDKPIADATPSPLPAGSRLLQDLGFLAFTLPQVAILMPPKQPRGQELTLEQHRTNQALYQRRLRIEHVNSSVGSVSKVEMATPIGLIYKALFPSISTFETPPCCSRFSLARGRAAPSAPGPRSARPRSRRHHDNGRRRGYRGSVAKFDFWGKIQKSGIRNSTTYRLPKSRKSN